MLSIVSSLFPLFFADNLLYIPIKSFNLSVEYLEDVIPNELSSNVAVSISNEDETYQTLVDWTAIRGDFFQQDGKILVPYIVS